MVSSNVFGIGDNKEFGVATAGIITVYFYNASGKTAANDDPANGNYYFSNPRTAKQFILRTDQTVQITEIGHLQATILTDPITVAIGDGTVVPASGLHREKYEHPVVSYLKINIQTANTNLKIRIL